ncbi:ParB/RepB/Spo0J family partition protein [Phytomonospora sp. NPDC050363]|uniref:ParB/RepB/Spo0J family partition protein n=1 Tax=Phytomonospora sp. NPDC050363 TaxID=3155642 RepID=UPI0033C16111
MPAKFGVPPEGARIRSLIKERLNQAVAEDGAKITIDWRGEQKHLHVISIPVDLLYFNPDTHRIRAQRTLDPERDGLLEEKPWAPEAQEYLHHLLTRKAALPDELDAEYEVLKNELKEFGQKEPGVISPDGILVDGNTRCAALRDLGVKDIRAGVLPNDTSRDDINRVELAVQLRRDKRREYSYINRLIAIEEQLASGRLEEDVARAFNIRPKTLRIDRGVYQMIMEAIRRSRTGGDQITLRLVDLESHQESLRELIRDYSELKKSDPDGAEILKESRLAMVILDYPKTSLRHAEGDFFSRYVDERLPSELRPTAQEVEPVEVPGLGVTIPDAASAVKTSRALTDALLQAKAMALAADTLEPGAVTAATGVLQKAGKTFDDAVKLAGSHNTLKKRRAAVPERLTDAADYINQCAAEFAEAKAKRALDEDAFDEALVVLRSSLIRLARLAGRTFPAPGDGVEWLLSAARED